MFTCLTVWCFPLFGFGLDFLREEGLIENHIIWGGVGRKMYGQHSHIYINFRFLYSETLNKEYIERIHQMSYSSLSDNGMLQIFSF